MTYKKLWALWEADNKWPSLPYILPAYLICVFDIRSMIKNSLKKEIIPYLLLVILARQ
jgi:hypothetical protein